MSARLEHRQNQPMIADPRTHLRQESRGSVKGIEDTRPLMVHLLLVLVMEIFVLRQQALQVLVTLLLLVTMRLQQCLHRLGLQLLLHLSRHIVVLHP
jgi:hypothetical protein